MPITREEFAEFTRFAEQKISNGGVESFEELIRQWRAARELAGLIADIEQSEADIDAGRVAPLDQAFADIRQRLRWRQ